MAEIRSVTTLIAKRDEIERSIANYEARLEQARADLSHVNAVISIFEAAGDRDTTTAVARQSGWEGDDQECILTVAAD
jgi:hypothetical protein